MVAHIPVSHSNTSPSQRSTETIDEGSTHSHKSKHRRSWEVLGISELDDAIYSDIGSTDNYDSGEEGHGDQRTQDEAQEAFRAQGERFLARAKLYKQRVTVDAMVEQYNHYYCSCQNANYNNQPAISYARPLGMPPGRALPPILSQNDLVTEASDVAESEYGSDGLSNFDSLASSDVQPSQSPPKNKTRLIELQLTDSLLSAAVYRKENITSVPKGSSHDDEDEDGAVVDSRINSHRTPAASTRRQRQEQKKRKKGKRASKQQRHRYGACEDGEDDSSTLEKRHMKRYLRELEKEKVKLVQAWQKEFESTQVDDGFHRECHFFSNLVQAVNDWQKTALDWLSFVECFISNLPLTIGAVGLSWVTQGVIWFKFMEENIDSCTTVRFNSPQCTYPEFPGCFECDITNWTYIAVVSFHYFCHCVAGLCCVLFLLKCCIASKVVADELSNPTTSTPAGVVCITMICVAAGRGAVGEIIVMVTSLFHIVLSFWFLYMAIYQYRLWPDPGWFPNTVGIAYAAIKTWLYFPVPGMVFMSLCVVYLFGIFGIAVYRAAYNHKIAAPVCFISLSAPSITMYAMTIMAQPTYREEQVLLEDRQAELTFEHLHKSLYLPGMHFMMIMCLVGFAASIQCLWTRWPQFKLKQFSPAHVAFVFPLLSHTNAVQAYRSGYISFSQTPVGTPFKRLLFTYWFICLVVGTVLNFIFTYKYVVRLPQWTKADAWKIVQQRTTGSHHEDSAQDIESSFRALQQSQSTALLEPGQATELVSEFTRSNNGCTSSGEEDEPSVVQSWMKNKGVHEVMHQPFTNPSVLHANEKGVLMRVRRGTADYELHGPYVRTRQVESLGFDPILTQEEFEQERRQLLDYVAKNAPRKRNRTMSIPVIMELQAPDGSGVYGTFSDGMSGRNDEGQQRQQSSLRGDSTGTGSDSSDGRRKYRHQRSNTWSNSNQK